MKVRVTVLVILAVFRCLSISISAATIYVSPSGLDGDDGLSWGAAKLTIQAGVTAAVGGGHTNVVVSNGLYTVTTSITVQDAITVQSYSTNVADTIIRRTSGANPIFRVYHPSAVVDGFTIENGNGNGGGVTITNGTVQNCVISNCYSVQYGPAVYMTGGVVSNCLMTDNDSCVYGNSTGGGSVRMTGGKLIQCTIQNSWSRLLPGGGVHADGGMLDACTIRNNLGAKGGGVYLEANGAATNCIAVNSSGTITGCVVALNSAHSYGWDDKIRGGGINLAGNAHDYLVCRLRQLTHKV